MHKNSEIYSQGYKKWERTGDYAIPPWLLIGQAGIRNIVTSSGCLARVVFFIFFVNYYFLVIAGSLAHFQWENLKNYDLFRGILEAFENSGLKITELDFHQNNILIPSIVFSVFAMLFYGSQLIAKDKRANALQVYFSKAISRTDYVVGKFYAIGVFTSLVTLVPSAIILGMGVIFASDHTQFFLNSWYIPLITGAYWLMLTFTFGSITLGCSSFFNKSYMAGVSFIGVQVFLMVCVGLSILIFGASDFLMGFNWFSSIYHLGSAIFDLELKNKGKLFWSLIDVGLICALALFLIFRRIEPVEVVK